MAYYEPLADGSSVVRTDDGRELRTALPPEQLEQSGFQLAARDFSQLDNREMPPEPTPPQPGAATAPPQVDPMKALTDRLDAMRSQYDPEYAARAEQRKQAEKDQAENERTQQILSIAKRNSDAAKAQLQSQYVSGDDAAGLDPNTQFIDVPSGGLNLPPGFEPYQKPKPPNMERVVTGGGGVPSAQAPSATPSAGSDSARAIYDIAMRGALKRSAVSPGGLIPSTKTQQRGEVVSPEDLASVDDAEREAEAVKLRNAEESAAALQRDIIGPQAAALQRDMDNLGAQYERRKAYDAKLAQLESYARQQENKATSMKSLTPSDEMFKGFSGGIARVLSAIGQALGAYAATGSGSPNFAHEIAQDAIREVAEKQRRDAEQAAAAGRNARNAYTDALQQYGNPEMAQQALYDRGEAIYRKMLELNAAKHGTPEMVARIKADNADAETQRRMRWAERNGKAAGAVSESYRYVPPSGGGVSKMLSTPP